MTEPFPRASPGVPSMAMALRLGAGPAKAAPTRRSVRRIFPAAHVAGKNDSDSFRLAPETRKGKPLPGFFPGGRGTKVPGQLLTSIGGVCYPARRLAALPAGASGVAWQKAPFVERGTFASAAGGGKSAQKGVAVVKIL